MLYIEYVGHFKIGNILLLESVDGVCVGASSLLTFTTHCTYIFFYFVFRSHRECSRPYVCPFEGVCVCACSFVCTKIYWRQLTNFCALMNANGGQKEE